MNPVVTFINWLENMKKPEVFFELSPVSLELFKVTMNMMLLLNGAAAIALISDDLIKFAFPIFMFSSGSLLVPAICLYFFWISYPKKISDEKWSNISKKIVYCACIKLIFTFSIVITIAPLGFFIVGVTSTVNIITMEQLTI